MPFERRPPRAGARSAASAAPALVTALATAFALVLACPGADRSPGSDLRVRPGIDVLLDRHAGTLEGRRVGLITNHTGLTADGRRNVDVLVAHPGVELVALYAPEHGFAGTAAPGAAQGDARDPRTGLPVRSLYGATRKPTPGMLRDVDALVFDIQDIGARYYTYVSTMALAMEAAAELDLPFIVLDRPNPITGATGGNILDPEFASFTGMFPVPMRHGLTVGELARLVNEEFGIAARLTVVPVDGWRRDLWYDETGLPWVPPSPNIPRLASAHAYVGTCLLEGTNLSVGRGTDRPFEQLGAPWLDADSVARAVAAYGLPGVVLSEATVRPLEPSDGKFDGIEIAAVRIEITERDLYRPVATALALLIEIRRRHPRDLRWVAAHFDRLAGTDRIRTMIEAGADLESVTEGWSGMLEDWEARAAPYLLYR